MKSTFLRLQATILLALAASSGAWGAADYTTAYTFATFAGTSSIGGADGTGADARFYSPQAITTDSAGNLYIADEGNHTIRKVTPAGAVTTFAGTAGVAGSADGTGADARFDSPQGVVSDAADNLYVADTGNHLIRKITPAGVVTTLAGLADVTGNTDGTGSGARFNLPRRLARDSTGNLYVTETGNHAIRKITAAGVVTTVAATGLSFPEHFNGAYGAIAVDTAGNLYVSTFAFSDQHNTAPDPLDNHTRYVGYVVRLAPNGNQAPLWQTQIQQYADGRIVNSGVSSLTVDASGDLVANSGYQIIRRSASTDQSTVLAGSGLLGAADGPADTARFGFPVVTALDKNNALYVADAGNNIIRKVTADGTVTTIAGLALENAAQTLDGTGTAARLTFPAGMAFDTAGNLYYADSGAHCIRKITPAGAVSNLAGVPGSPGRVDGMGTAARFFAPTGLVLDAGGNLYVTDTENNAIRRVSPAGETTTFAGTLGTSGTQDGVGTAAQFSYPRGIGRDAAGNLFVADTSAGTIRKITPGGTVSTYAGSPYDSGSTDGAADAARFTGPYGVTVDGEGNVFVSEVVASPSISRIRKITPAGMVSTIAGAGAGYEDGSAGAGRFHHPFGLAADATGNLFVADSENQAVRRITPQGAVSTLAGLRDAPGDADGTGKSARFYYPHAIATDAAGTLYVASGTTIKKGLLAILPTIVAQPQSVTVNAGASVSFSVTASGTPTPTYRWQRNGADIAGATGSSLNLGSVQSTDAGDYTVIVTNPLGSVTSAKAVLSVTSTPPPPPPPPSGGGGGGGAPSWWFLAALATLGILHRKSSRQAAAP